MIQYDDSIVLMDHLSCSHVSVTITIFYKLVSLFDTIKKLNAESKFRWKIELNYYMCPIYFPTFFSGELCLRSMG